MRSDPIHRPAQLGLAWLIGLALLAGCDRTPPTSGPAPTSTPAAAMQSEAGNSQAQAPVVNRPPDEEIALQRLQAHWASQENGQAFEHRRLERLLLPDAAYGNHFILGYASRAPDDTCSACMPSLSFFEFRRDADDSQPRLLRAYVAAVKLGYAGQAPHPRLQMLGRHRYAITLFWASYGMGVYPQLTVLMPIRGRMRKVFDETIGGQYDLHNREMQDLGFVYWKSLYSFQPGPGLYPDLHLERHFLENRSWLRDARHGEFANEPSVNGQVPTRLVYRFDGRRYRRVIADQRPPRKHYECWKDSDDYEERID